MNVASVLDRLGPQMSLSTLALTGLMDVPADEGFDRVTRLVVRTLGVPVALVSLVEEEQHVCKSQIGLPEPWGSSHETPVLDALCRSVVASADALRIDDVRMSASFTGHTATGTRDAVAYLGVPLRGPGGHVLGSLCAADTQPRTWTDHDVATLLDLAAIVEDQLGLSASEKKWREILNTMPQMVWSTLADGYHDFYNNRWYEFTGMPRGSTDGEAWSGMLHDEDQDRARDRWRQSLASGEPYEIEYRLRHRSGDYRWTLGRALPIRARNGAIERWFGTCTDIHELKQAETARDLIAQELSHRIKNIFAVVNSLISLSARGMPVAGAFAQSVGSRIEALANAHRYVEPDLIRGLRNSPSDHDPTVHGLIATVLAPYTNPVARDRIVIEGFDTTVDVRASTSLALVLHELATNAVKYGALSLETGHITVTCSASGNDIKISWRERGGPPLTNPPAQTGFGSKLVMLTTAQLGARVERHWDPDGLTVDIEIPIGNLDRH